MFFRTVFNISLVFNKLIYKGTEDSEDQTNIMVPDNQKVSMVYTEFEELSDVWQPSVFLIDGLVTLV